MSGVIAWDSTTGISSGLLYGGGYTFTAGGTLDIENGQVPFWFITGYLYDVNGSTIGEAGVCNYCGGGLGVPVESYQSTNPPYSFYYQNLDTSGSWSTSPPSSPGPGMPATPPGWTPTKSLAWWFGNYFDQAATAFDVAATVVESQSNKVLAKRLLVFAGIKALNELIPQTVWPLNSYSAFKIAAARLTKTNAASIVLEADSIAFSLAAVASYAIANDPPDPNYTIVARPQDLSLPATGNATVDQVVADYLKYESLEIATLHAVERWQGAMQANDPASETLQLEAFQIYSRQAKEAEAPLTADNLALIQAIPPVDVNSFPGGPSALAAAFNAQCGQPLPVDLNAVILSFGFSQPAIDLAVCNAANSFTASNTTADFETILSEPLPMAPVPASATRTKP